MDGLILCSSRLEEAELQAVLARHSAVVLVNRRDPEGRFGAVLIDDVRGGRMMVEHLISRGHRQIGFLAGPARSFSGAQRAVGYRAALEAAGIPHRPAWERPCLPIVESGREVAHDLLSCYPEITALFCYNDLSAIGALHACADLGRRVPEDVAIAGYDDIPMAALVTLSVTTCRLPKTELGGQAMRLLLDHPQLQRRLPDIIIQPQLIIARARLTGVVGRQPPEEVI